MASGEDVASGVQIISDGTSEGTRVLLDGRAVHGVTHVEWKINRRTRKAVLVLAINDVRIDARAQVDPEVRAALEKVTDSL